MAYKQGDVFVCDACLTEFTVRKITHLGLIENSPRCCCGEPMKFQQSE